MGFYFNMNVEWIWDIPLLFMIQKDFLLIGLFPNIFLELFHRRPICARCGKRVQQRQRPPQWRVLSLCVYFSHVQSTYLKICVEFVQSVEWGGADQRFCPISFSISTSCCQSACPPRRLSLIQAVRGKERLNLVKRRIERGTCRIWGDLESTKYNTEQSKILSHPITVLLALSLPPSLSLLLPW